MSITLVLLGWGARLLGPDSAPTLLARLDEPRAALDAVAVEVVKALLEALALEWQILQNFAGPVTVSVVSLSISP